MKKKRKNTNSIKIKELSEFFSLTSNKVKNIKSFYFENLLIDDNFLMHLTKLSLNNLDSFYFRKCIFYEPNVLSSIIYCKNIGFIDCGLSLVDIKSILEWILIWKKIDTLDLSGNNLGKNQMEFFKWLNRNIWCNIYIKNFILSDNNFTADFKIRMLEHNEWFKSFDNISL